jgi:hypothetical protein
MQFAITIKNLISQHESKVFNRASKAETKEYRLTHTYKARGLDNI